MDISHDGVYEDDTFRDDISQDDTYQDDTHKAAVSRQMTDEEINEKYVKGNIRIVTEQARYPLPAIAGMIKSNDYELNPEFQRRRRWDAGKKSRLIESFIMNVPVPPIFLYEYIYSHYEVMDGIQRLFTILEFYNNELVLTGLKEWKELEGRTYSELPEQIQRGIDRRYLSSVILLYETAKDPEEAQRLKQLVFERINSGGVELEPQESRNALYNGPLNKLCIKLSRNIHLCKTWKIPEPTEDEISQGVISNELQKNETYSKMDDVELVLRFFAFKDNPAPRTALRDFFDEYLKEGNKYSPQKLNEYELLYNNTIKLVYDTFHESAFYIWRRRRDHTWAWYEKPTIIAYDALMYVFSQYIKSTETIISHRQEFQDNIKEIYESNPVTFSGRKTNQKYIVERRKLFTSLVTDIIGKA